jgi:hypothetical protein
MLVEQMAGKEERRQRRHGAGGEGARLCGIGGCGGGCGLRQEGAPAGRSSACVRVAVAELAGHMPGGRGTYERAIDAIK